VAHFRFVDIPSGRTIGRLPSHPTSGLDHHRLAWVHFSPDGELFAVAENDRLRVWDVPPRQPLALFLTLTAVLGAVVVGLARWRLCRQAAAAG
jgi:WD40 repeat protein